MCERKGEGEERCCFRPSADFVDGQQHSIVGSLTDKGFRLGSDPELRGQKRESEKESEGESEVGRGCEVKGE